MCTCVIVKKHQPYVCTSLYTFTATMCIIGWFETGVESIKAATLQEGHSLEKLSTSLYTVSPWTLSVPVRENK